MEFHGGVDGIRDPQALDPDPNSLIWHSGVWVSQLIHSPDLQNLGFLVDLVAKYQEFRVF